MWKCDEVVSLPKRGSIGSFANSIELSTISEKERESEHLSAPKQQSILLDRNSTRNDPPSLTRLGSSSSLAAMFKNMKRGRSCSLPFLQRGSPRNRTESAAIFIDTMSSLVSGLYCMVLAILGLALRISELFASTAPSRFYQSFYIYLHTVSLLYLALVYTSMAKRKSSVDRATNTNNATVPSTSTDQQQVSLKRVRQPLRYGSFYLRMGAIGFGMASIVYSGLELGQYFELLPSPTCSHIMMALTPASRMLFIVVQLQFIFISDKQEALSEIKLVSKFGLMHMIATNLCVWMSVLIQETRHEVIAIASTRSAASISNSTTVNNITQSEWIPSFRPEETLACQKSNIMRRLASTASPYLYPCVIEYNLICTVILYALWTFVCGRNQLLRQNSAYGNKSPKPVTGYSSQHFTVDCANAHKGLFASVVVLVVSIISLIMFLVLVKERGYRSLAELQINLCEMILYILCTIASLSAMYKIRKLKYARERELELDTVLLVTSQGGLYVYFTFSLLAGYLTSHTTTSKLSLYVTPLLGLVQSSLQTIVIVDCWWRRCHNLQTARTKPARQLVTFLLLSNIAIWAINHLENAKPDYHPTELNFYGARIWTLVTHISMPLAVFYRFHSTVCFCEIWKSAYKYKHQ